MSTSRPTNPKIDANGGCGELEPELASNLRAEGQTNSSTAPALKHARLGTSGPPAASAVAPAASAQHLTGPNNASAAMQ